MAYAFMYFVFCISKVCLTKLKIQRIDAFGRLFIQICLAPNPHVEPILLWPFSILAHVLRLGDVAHAGAEVGAQGAIEELEQHLEADAGESGVVAALGQLVADEGVLGPGMLVEREGHAGIVQRLADQVAARRRDVGVTLAEDLWMWY